MRPLVSILAPTFNHEKFIGECIESVLNQTVKEWEMIIIDDGSSDSTPDIIRQYHDPRIIYIRKEHKGIDFLGENYNHALEISRGEFILILEGDDYIPPKRLEIQLPSFNDKEVVLSHGKYAHVCNCKSVVFPTLFKKDILNNQPLGEAFKAFLSGFNPIGTQSVMIRKSALLEIGGFTQPLYLPLVDYPTWMKLALNGRFEFIPEILGYWRRHPLSITMNRNEEIFEGFLRYCDEFVKTYSEDLKRLNLAKVTEKRGAIAYLALSLKKVSDRNYRAGRRFVRESLKRIAVLNWSFKLRVIVAFISAYLQIDILKFFIKVREWFYQK